MSWKRPEDALKKTLQDLLTMSWKCLEDVFARRLLNVVTKRLEDVFKASWRHLENVWSRQIYPPWSRYLEDFLNTSAEDEDKIRLHDVFETSSSRGMFAGSYFHIKHILSNRIFFSVFLSTYNLCHLLTILYTLD